MFLKKTLALALALAVLAACQPVASVPVELPQTNVQQPEPALAAPASDLDVEEAAESAALTATAPAPTQAPTSLPTHEPTQAPTSAPAAPVTPATSGPETYPAGVSPLTGLPVSNPENLKSPPALVSITNFPIEARPQAGLSYSPFVHELYIGEGTTRFLAMFYGDFPSQAVDENEPVTSGNVVTDNAEIGPIRSGRLPYEHLRKLYNGFLVMASADPSVGATLNQTNNVFGSDPGNINSAMINVNALEKTAQNAQKNTGAVSLPGLRFDAAAPNGGQPASSLWVPYALLDQVVWRYNAADGSYHRYQDQADGKTFVEYTDRINNQPLTYENVVVLFATHHAYAETLIDVDLLGIKKMPALLFRDGKVYNIFWTSANGEYERTTGKLRPIRFIDEQGNPFPLKPGQTWIHIMPTYCPVYETVDSVNYLDKVESKATPGSGNWAVRFFAPNIEPKPTPVK